MPSGSTSGRPPRRSMPAPIQRPPDPARSSSRLADPIGFIDPRGPTVAAADGGEPVAADGGPEPKPPTRGCELPSRRPGPRRHACAAVASARSRRPRRIPARPLSVPNRARRPTSSDRSRRPSRARSRPTPSSGSSSRSSTRRRPRPASASTSQRARPSTSWSSRAAASRSSASARGTHRGAGLGREPAAPVQAAGGGRRARASIRVVAFSQGEPLGVITLEPTVEPAPHGRASAGRTSLRPGRAVGRGRSSRAEPADRRPDDVHRRARDRRQARVHRSPSARPIRPSSSTSEAIRSVHARGRSVRLLRDASSRRSRTCPLDTPKNSARSPTGGWPPRAPT